MAEGMEIAPAEGSYLCLSLAALCSNSQKREIHTHTHTERIDLFEGSVRLFDNYFKLRQKLIVALSAAGP